MDLLPIFFIFYEIFMVLVTQINLMKNKLASSNLMRKIANSSKDILYLIQEPYLYRDKVPGLPTTYTMYGANDVAARAIILAPKIFPLFELTHLTGRDCVTTLFKSGNIECYFVSIYCDCTLPVISSLVNQVVDYIEVKDAAAIFCLDSNAHSVLYSDILESDSRGQIVEDFIMTHEFFLLNEAPFYPSYTSSRYSSCIDISLVRKNSFKKHVTGWFVSKEHTFSDHNFIQFKVELGIVPPPLRKIVDWPHFTDNVQEQLKSESSHYYWTNQRVENEAIRLTNSLMNAIQLSTNLQPVKARQQKFWRGDDLHALRKECAALWGKMRIDYSLENRAAYNSKLKVLRKSLRRAKRKSWQEFCNTVDNTKDMSYLNKALKGKANNNVGSIKISENRYTTSPIETLNFLMHEHFPECTTLLSNAHVSEAEESNRQQADSPLHSQSRESRTLFSSAIRRAIDRSPQSGNICTKESLKDSFITESTVRAVFNSFGPDKIGGCDEIRPKALQNLPDMAIKRFTTLFQAIIEIGYTPKIWRESRVVFIPKQGKTDYTDVRAWRPVTLSSFLIKSVEKLVLWQLDELSLINDSLSKDQHAFRAGYSTESALSDFVDDIESSITRDQIALGVFLDIKGAFDNCQHTTIVDQMRLKNFPKKLVDWYEHYLKNRIAHSTLKGQTCSIKVNKGTPQGGILSPLAWNLVFEDFLDTMSNSAVRTRCFADDACLLIKGICPSVMTELMQVALTKAVQWGNANSLHFVPSKTVALFFHRKRKFQAPKKLVMSNQTIEYSKYAKYLGVFLDTKLNFTYHIQNKIKQAKKLVMALRNAVGAHWGPVPRVLKWAYSGIVLPIVGYGSFLFARECKKLSIRKKLNSLNRLMALTLMSVRKSTPTSGLEIILGMPPIDIKLEEMALNAILRILPHNRTRWDGVGRNSIGHLRWGLDKLRAHGITQKAFDLTKDRNLNKRYEVDLDFKSGLPTTNDQISCYTDGSKIDQGNTGYGFGVVQNEEIIAQGNGQLSKANSVFQGEIMGITKACEALYEEDGFSCTIFSDSQSALMALASPTVKSKAVKNCINKLNNLGSQKLVTLKWVKAHNSHKFNDFADKMAKEGTKNSANKVDIPPPNSWAKEILAKKMYKEWSERWTSLEEARQTKIWFVRPDKALSSQITLLNRSNLGLFVQMVTGHNRLNYHESMVNRKPEEASCRFCNEAPESSWHLIGECDALWNQRCTSFESMHIEKPPKWKLYQVLKFLRISKMAKLNDRSEQISVADEESAPATQ